MSMVKNVLTQISLYSRKIVGLSWPSETSQCYAKQCEHFTEHYAPHVHRFHLTLSYLNAPLTVVIVLGNWKTTIMEIECNFIHLPKIWLNELCTRCANRRCRDILTRSVLITGMPKEAYKTDFIGHICILMVFVFELMEYLHGILCKSYHEIEGYWNNFPFNFFSACSFCFSFCSSSCGCCAYLCFHIHS